MAKIISLDTATQAQQASAKPKGPKSPFEVCDTHVTFPHVGNVSLTPFLKNEGDRINALALNTFEAPRARFVEGGPLSQGDVVKQIKESLRHSDPAVVRAVSYTLLRAWLSGRNQSDDRGKLIELATYVWGSFWEQHSSQALLIVPFEDESIVQIMTFPKVPKSSEQIAKLIDSAHTDNNVLVFSHIAAGCFESIIADIKRAATGRKMETRKVLIIN